MYFGQYQVSKNKEVDKVSAGMYNCVHPQKKVTI